MKFFCPVCGCPNETHSTSEKIRCIRCGAVFSPPEIQSMDTGSDSSSTQGTAGAESAAAATSAAQASIDAAATVLEAVKKSGADMDPELTARIIAEATKAAATATAAAKAAEAAAAAAAASNQNLNRQISGRTGSVQAARGTQQTVPARSRQASPEMTQKTAQTRRTAETGAAKATSGPRYAWRQFADSKTGIILAKAVVPESFTSAGNLDQTWQSDIVPFTASFQASSPDRSILLSSTSGEIFIWYPDPLLDSMAKKGPNLILSSFREFIDTEDYLQQYAQRMVGIPLTPTARTKLPSAYGKNLTGERQRLLQYIEAHRIDISVRETISTCYCDAFLYRYEGESKGRKIVVLAGCDYKGTESYDANGSAAMLNMQAGLFGVLMRGVQKKSSKSADRKRRKNKPAVSPTGVGEGNIPFGYGKEYGKNVDVVNWGSERLYFMAAPIEAERAATEAFLRFVASITPDPALWKQRSLLIEQKHQSRILEAQALNTQARQMQIEAQRRQRELARQLQANSESISRGIMDSWEKKNASDSRISSNWSEAIRGVDTYRTPSGGTVEASVSADHVYQNRYGDTIEVSGNELDDEITARLDWTKLNREN